MKPLQPLRLSAVVTFGLVGILALSADLSLKDRAQLVNEIERLRWQMAYPVHPSERPDCFDEEQQLVDGGDRTAKCPRG